MLNKKDLEKFKSVLGFNLGQVEKDYLQHLVLLFFSNYITTEVIFKGGTALQKAYALNRFSEDLDFTLVKKIDLDIIIKKVNADLNNFGFITESEQIKSKTSKNYRLKIKGPLFEGTEKTIATLRIEVSLRNDLLFEADLKENTPIYTDIRPYSIFVMNPKEILAEKIRAIFQREKARDVYDLAFLLKKGVKIDLRLIEKKLGFFNLKFNKNIFFKRIDAVKNIWKKELTQYVNNVPDFIQIKKEIKIYFEQI